MLARQLDQSKIGPASFRVESRPLSAAEKIKLRKLFQTVGIPCKSNEEALAAGRFLQELQSRATDAGGEPPMPARPDTKHLDDLKVLELEGKEDDIEQGITWATSRGMRVEPASEDAAES